MLLHLFNRRGAPRGAALGMTPLSRLAASATDVSASRISCGTQRGCLRVRCAKPIGEALEENRKVPRRTLRSRQAGPPRPRQHRTKSASASMRTATAISRIAVMAKCAPAHQRARRSDVTCSTPTPTPPIDLGPHPKPDRDCISRRGARLAP